MSLYAVFYLGSFFLFIILVAKLCKMRPLDAKYRNLLALVYLIGMVFGAHALYYLFVRHSWVNGDLQAFNAEFSGDVRQWFANLPRFRSAGLAGLWGGPWYAILSLLPFAFLLKVHMHIKYDMLDVFAVSFPFALSLAKIGCFVNGCCYGIEGTGPLFLRFTWVPEHSSCYMKSCFPTQLVDLAIYGVIGVVLLALFRKQQQRGRLVLYFVLLYSVGRFASEFTRGDAVGGKVFGLSPVQVILIASFVQGTILVCWPPLFDTILGIVARQDGDRTETAPTISPSIAKLDNRLFVFTILLVPLCFFFLQAPIPLLLLIVPFLAHLYASFKNKRDPVQWSRTFNACAAFGMVFLFVTAFLFVNLGVFHLAFVAFGIVSSALLNRVFDLVAQSDL